MNDKNEAKIIPNIFHVDLSDANPEEEYWLQAAGKKYPLVLHTDETRKKARLEAPHLESVPDHKLTHYTADLVHLANDSVVRVHVRHTLNTVRGAKGSYGLGNTMIYIPPETKPAEYTTAQHRPTPHHPPHIDYVSTAKTLIFHHADLVTQDKECAGIIYDHMDEFKSEANYAIISKLAEDMRDAGPPAEDSGWAHLKPIAVNGNVHYMNQPTDDIQEKAGPAMTAVMISTKNDERLKGKKWHLQEGTSVVTAGNDSSLMLKAAEIQAVEAADSWAAKIANDHIVCGLKTEVAVVNSQKKQIKITMTNSYIRYLAAYIEFYDADGKVMSVPDWKPADGSDIVADLEWQYDNFRYLGYINPTNTVFTIPTGPDGVLTVTVTFPDGAVGAGVYGCGLGTGSNLHPKASIIGGTLTGLVNLGIPAFMLGFQVAAQSYKPLYDIISENWLKIVVAGAVYFGAQFAYTGAVHKKMDWNAFSSLSQILFTKAATKALVWCEEQTLARKIEEEIPFAGWIMIAINIATGIMQIAETIIAVSTSPWEIKNTVSETITSTVTIHPDPRHGAFPQPPDKVEASYVTKMIYKDNSPTKEVSNIVPAGSTPTTLSSSFKDNTLGGYVKFEVDFYLGDWVAGKAYTGWLPNDDEHTANIVLYLVQQPIPLSNKSIYQHTSILTYRDGAYQWTPESSAPTATITNRNTANTGNAISEWNGLTLSQRYGMIGFSWKAAGMGIRSCVGDFGGTQLNAFQNINIPGKAMDAIKFPCCGFDQQTQLVYDNFPQKFLMENGQFVIGPDGKPKIDPQDTSLGNYYIDPIKAMVPLENGGGYHLRKVILENSTPFDTSPDQKSWGRFAYFPNSFAIHPSGHLIGISSKYCKIQVLKVPEEGDKDDALPVAREFAGKALNKERHGLLLYPIAVACSYDGTILILDQLISNDLKSTRIQAFDMNGNPVYCFHDKSSNPSPFLELPSDVTYLDLAVVGNRKMTYMYVLYYEGSGQDASSYHIAIYQYGIKAPASNPLVITDKVAAAKISVDMWHTLYTLNYEMVTDGSGNPSGPKNESTGPAGRTVPSVSEWLPPLP